MPIVAKKVVVVTAVPLYRAMLCVNCDYISDATQDCPICESKALMSVSRLLNKGRAVEKVEEVLGQ